MLVDEDNTFASQLPSDLKAEYNKLKSGKIKEITKQLEPNYGDFFALKDRGIKQDKFHKEVLNSCIFPFVQTGLLSSELDYAYLRSSPLSELKLKNVDFLIASQSKGIAIFGEAKGSVEDPNEVISQYRKRIEVIEQNESTVKQYVPNLKKIEYVLGVPSMDSNNTIKAVLRSKINIKVWETGGMGTQQLSLVVPPNVNENNVRELIMHFDNDLNKALSKLSTSTATKTFFQESHPVTKMQLLTALDKGGNNSISFTQVQKIVEEELDNSTEDEVEETTREIIRTAIDINFLNCKDNGYYKIQSIYKNPKSRYDELKKKWIDRKFEQERDNKINVEIKKIQKEYLDKKEKRPNLESWFEKG